jgi:hypothetical protein
MSDTAPRAVRAQTSRQAKGASAPAPGGKYALLRLPLTAALVRAGLAGLSMSTPGHRAGRLFGAWEAPRDRKAQ